MVEEQEEQIHPLCHDDDDDDDNELFIFNTEMPYTEDEFYGLDGIPPEQVDDEFAYLHQTDRNSILNLRASASTDFDWGDCLTSDKGERTIFNLNTSVKDAWEGFKKEADFIRNRVSSMVFEEDGSIDNRVPTLKELVLFSIGPKSSFGTVFCKELGLDENTYCNFLATVCMQMSYHETPSSMYHASSLLRSSTVMDKDEYIGIWQKIATLKKVSRTKFVDNGRRPECLWKIMENVLNIFLRSIAIAGRDDKIDIALDDDKVWIQNSGVNAEDHFTLRKVTHIKDNRKGIISHTAGSTTTNILYCTMFEQQSDTATTCFKKIFNHLFPSSSSIGSELPDLNDVSNFSDRGYTIKETLFDYLLPANADFNNTVKRIPPFPFVWDMRVPEGDRRTKLDAKGAPALFVKDIKKHNRLVTCTAFRTGTNNISTVVSSTLHGHQWEGVCLSDKQQAMYEADKHHGLDCLLFKKIASSKGLFDEFADGIADELVDLLLFKIDAITIEQGTADWFKARQFSLTSSQAGAGFGKAFVIFQDEIEWNKVATFLHGEKYYERKFI